MNAAVIKSDFCPVVVLHWEDLCKLSKMRLWYLLTDQSVFKAQYNSVCIIMNTFLLQVSWDKWWIERRSRQWGKLLWCHSRKVILTESHNLRRNKIQPVHFSNNQHSGVSSTLLTKISADPIRMREWTRSLCLWKQWGNSDQERINMFLTEG